MCDQGRKGKGVAGTVVSGYGNRLAEVGPNADIWCQMSKAFNT